MIRKIFLLILLAASFKNTLHADQIAIQADIVISDDCPDYTTWNTRALITELKKLKSDIFLYYAGQLPCTLLTILAASGAVLCTAKAVTHEWSPFAYLGTLACTSASPAFAALYLILENKKILARYNCDEINEQLARNTDALTTV